MLVPTIVDVINERKTEINLKKIPTNLPLQTGKYIRVHSAIRSTSENKMVLNSVAKTLLTLSSKQPFVKLQSHVSYKTIL